MRKGSFVASVASLALIGCASTAPTLPPGYPLGEGTFLHEGALGKIHTQIAFFDTWDCNRYIKWVWPKYARDQETPRCNTADLSAALPWKARVKYSETRSLQIASATKERCVESLDVGMLLARSSGEVVALCEKQQ